jgi:hypothetical protein
MMSIIMLNVIYAERYYAECCYVECCGALRSSFQQDVHHLLIDALD